MSTLEIHLNNMNSTSEGGSIVTGLEELLGQELKNEDSVDCFIKRVDVETSGDSSEFSLSYAAEQQPSVTNTNAYTPKGQADNDDSSSLVKELEVTNEKDITSTATTVEHIQETDVENGQLTDVENVQVTSEDVEVENVQAIDVENVVQVAGIEATEVENVEVAGVENIEANDIEENVEVAGVENIEANDIENAEVAGVENIEANDVENVEVENIEVDVENAEVTGVENTEGNDTENAEATGVEDIETTTYIENDVEVTGMELVQSTVENSQVTEDEKVQICEEEQVAHEVPVLGSDVEVSQQDLSGISADGPDPAVHEIEEKGEDIFEENKTDYLEPEEDATLISKETNLVQREGNLMVEVVGSLQTENDDCMIYEEMKHEVETQNSNVEETTEEAEMKDVSESAEDSTAQNEPEETTGVVSKDTLYVVFHPKEAKNIDDAHNEEGRETSESVETQGISDNVTIKSSTLDKSVPTTVLRIASSSGLKSIKEMNKPIIIKTARIIKNGKTIITKATDHNSEDSNTTKDSTNQEKKQQDSSDDSKDDKQNSSTTETLKQNVILTKRVFGSIKKSQKSLPKKQGKIAKEESSEVEVKNNDRKINLNKNSDKGGRILVKPKGMKQETPGKKTGETQKDKGFSGVKRKLEEVCKKSREDEVSVMKEVKKMKRETLDILKRINAEMETLQFIFSARK